MVIVGFGYVLRTVPKAILASAGSRLHKKDPSFPPSQIQAGDFPKLKKKVGCGEPVRLVLSFGSLVEYR